MPEGPEIRTAANFINEICSRHTFSGPVVRSDLAAKLPVVPFDALKYTLKAESRGKELKIHLCDMTSEPETKKKNLDEDGNEIKTLLFHFGMSGCFKFTPVSELPKHAHIQFHTSDKKDALSFVDYRRFGSWKINGDWGSDRGPDPITDYKEFRQNVLNNLNDPCFKKAICEAMLNQKYFNGIGNYLRAEILFRCQIAPFEEARKVLEAINTDDDDNVIKKENPDLLDLCHLLPKEVLELGLGKGYDVDHDPEDEKAFMAWLRCYYKDGMKNMVDKNGRTIWFSGQPGPLKPANAKSRGKAKERKPKKNEKKKSESFNDATDDKQNIKIQSQDETSKAKSTARRSKQEVDDVDSTKKIAPARKRKAQTIKQKVEDVNSTKKIASVNKSKAQAIKQEVDDVNSTKKIAPARKRKAQTIKQEVDDAYSTKNVAPEPHNKIVGIKRESYDETISVNTKASKSIDKHSAGKVTKSKLKPSSSKEKNVSDENNGAKVQNGKAEPKRRKSLRLNQL